MKCQFKQTSKDKRKCDKYADGEIKGQVEAFKYDESEFNTNETLLEFLLISNDRNQNQLMFHVCESSCMEMFSLHCLRSQEV